MAGSLPGSPFAFKVPGAWFFGTPSAGSGGGIATAHGFALLAALACGFAGLVLLSRAWLTISRRRAAEPEPTTRPLACILALWSVPLLVAPPMFSNDIYSYAAQGEMVSHHINPYLYGPGSLGATPFAALAQGVWINTPSPYGPLFSGLEGETVDLDRSSCPLSIVFLRLLAVVGVVLIAVFLRRWPGATAKTLRLVFSLGVLNPLVLLFLVGSGHNDALMIGLLVAGLSIARRGHAGWGIVLCALAGAIKIPGAVGVFAIAWTSVNGSRPLWRRAGVSGHRSSGHGCRSRGAHARVRRRMGMDQKRRCIANRDHLDHTIRPAHESRAPYIGVPASTFLVFAHLVGFTVAAVICVWALRAPLDHRAATAPWAWPYWRS